MVIKMHEFRKVAAFEIMFEMKNYPADNQALHFGLSANIFGLPTIWIPDPRFFMTI